MFQIFIDNGETQIKHIMQILSAIISWVEPPDVIAASIRSGGSERSFLSFLFQAVNKITGGKHLLGKPQIFIKLLIMFSFCILFQQ